MGGLYETEAVNGLETRGYTPLSHASGIIKTVFLAESHE